MPVELDPEPAVVARVEQRSGERHSQVLLVGRVRIDGADSACLVHDISRSGMMARFMCPVAVGDRLSVEVRRLLPMSGQVRWVRGQRAGVAFDVPHDVEHVFQRISEDGRIARSPRFPSSAAARLQIGSAHFDATVIDISLGGAKLTSGAPVTFGQTGQIQLRDAGGAFFGSVCWIRDDVFGFRFANTLPMESLGQALGG